MPRRDPLLDRALLEAATQYKPQENALRALLSGLAGSYTQGRRVAASNERAIVAATQAAQPRVSSAYDDALRVAQAQTAALGSSNDPEAMAYQRRVAEARANALNDLTQRGTAATEGRVYANQGARSEYFANKDKIARQLQDLAGQRGATAQTLYGKLRESQLDRGIERGKAAETVRSHRASEATANMNAQTAAAKARADAKAKTGLKWASPEQHASIKDQIDQALVYAQAQVGVRGRKETIDLLISGRPATKTTNSQGKEVTLPAIPKVAADAARAAANLAWDSSLSAGDVKRLHARRLKVKALGYPVRSRAKQGAVAGLQSLASSRPQLRPPG